MAIKHVQSDELNLRRQPEVSGGNIIAVLAKGQRVATLGPLSPDGWFKVSVDGSGAPLEGFVSGRLLRDAVSDAKERLMANAVAEWLRFDRGKGLEHLTPFHRFVGEMWAAIGLDLDGRDRDQPWSAAFISWIVRRAGDEYGGFRFAAAHSRYIHDSIVKREAGLAAPFWGFRLHEHKVGLGDLICQWREDKRTFDDARTDEAFLSHCDVVVEVAGGSVRALGGNTAHSVNFKTYGTNPGGFLRSENNAFAVLRNNL